MNKTVKRFGIGLLVFIIVSVIILTVIAAFFENKIGDRLLTEINKQLDTELEVGKFDLNLVSDFPTASAELHDVFLYDAMDGILLEAKTLSFQFALFSLFGDNIKVESVIARDGAMQVKIDKNGKTNFDIAKGSDEETEASDFSLSIEQATFEDIELYYVDERADQEMVFLLNEATTSGNFSNNEFSVKSVASIQSEFIEIGGERYVVGKNLAYDAIVNVDLQEGTYEFENANLELEGNVFNVNGMVTTSGKETDFDLKISSKDSNLESVFKFIPQKYVSAMADLQSSGQFKMDTSIKGKLSSTEAPKIMGSFQLKEGRITTSKLNNPIKDVDLTARFSNGKKQSMESSIFELLKFKGYFNRELVESYLKVTNFDSPTIDLKVDGVVPTQTLTNLLNLEGVKSSKGEIEVHNFKLKGKQKDMMSAKTIKKVVASGTIEFDDAQIVFQDEKLTLDKGNLRLNNNSLSVENLELEGAGTEIKLNGKFINILPVIFADESNSKKAELKFNAKVLGKRVDLDRLFSIVAIDVEEDEVSEEVMDSIQVAHTISQERLTKFLDGTIEIKVEEFNYHKIEGENFSGELDFENNEVELKGYAEAMEGAFNLDGKIFFKEKPYMKAKLVCDKIDFKEFFRQGENFGQEFIQAKHVKGTLNAQLAMFAQWDEEGEFVYDDLNVIGDLSIDDGSLKGFRMLYDFSDYIHISDLRNIHFDNMRNYLEIKKGKVYMPAMLIRSNAVNLMVNGEHTFENDFDYNVKVNAGQVLANKIKKQNKGTNPLPTKTKGWFNLYYNIAGDVDNYRVKSDKKNIKREFKLSEYRRDDIQSRLKKEFGSLVVIDDFDKWKNERPEYDKEDSVDDITLEGFDDKPAKPVAELEEKSEGKKPVKKIKEPTPKVIPEFDEEEGDVEYIEWEEGAPL